MQRLEAKMAALKLFNSLLLGLALLSAMHEARAYHPEPSSRQGGYYSGQGAGLSESTGYGSTSGHGSYNARIQDQQPIYERPPRTEQQDSQTNEYFAGCPVDFTGLLPYAYDCHRFLNCDKGRADIQTCGPGTGFNPETLVCDYANKVNCGVNAALGAQQHAEPQRNSRLSSAEVKCPPGLNGLHPHPTDCTKFLNCGAGQIFIQDCGPGTAFSASMLTCDHRDKVDCGERLYGRLLDALDGHVGGGLSCPPGAHGLHSHPHDLHKYLICGGVGVQTRVETCQPGTIFDSQRLVCVFSDNAESHYELSCKFLASVHTSDLFCPDGIVGVFAHPFDQTKFLNCKAGKTGVQSCGAFQVFSISKGQCLPKDNLIHSDYVAYVVSAVSHEYSMMLTNCPPGTDGLHFYPYDAAKYLYCASGGKMSIMSCEADMAYSIGNRACRVRRFVSVGDRVKFFAELRLEQRTYSYVESQAFQSALSSCPPSLNGAYPYSFHPTKYVLCQHGLLHVESCPIGSVFSLSQHKCLKSNVLLAHDSLDHTYIITNSQLEHSLSTELMQDLTTITCPPHAQGYYLHPFDCTKFISCRDQQTLIETCENGGVFSISQRRCVARDQLDAYDRVEYLVETQHEFVEEQQNQRERVQAHFTGNSITNIHLTGSGEVTCAVGATGLQPHPYDCNKFLNCANGQTFVQNCGPGTSFNPAIGTCDHADKVDCSAQKEPDSISHSSSSWSQSGSGGGGSSWSQSGSGGVGGSSSVSLGKGLSASSNLQGGQFEGTSNSIDYIKCPQTSYGLFAHPFDATLFLRCADGRTLVQHCSPSEVFSLSRSYCLPLDQVPSSDRVSFMSSNQSVSVTTTQAIESLSCPRNFLGKYVYPFDCVKFISCEAGATYLLSCPAGMHFSFSRRICLSLTEVQSEDRVHTASELQEFYEWWLLWSRQRQLQQQSFAITCPSGVMGPYQHPFVASKFLSCRPGQSLIYDCPENKLFSISRRLCVPQWELLAEDRCDYQVVMLNNKVNREPKSYGGIGDGGTHLGPWEVGTTTTMTKTTNNDRWTNMNMQRPQGIGFGQQQPSPSGYPHHGSIYQNTQVPQPGGWYGEGSRFELAAPTQSVLYVEGSLQPNRNYKPTATHTVYKAPLEPLATTTTTNIYYAEPVDSMELVNSWPQKPQAPRQNYSREINYHSNTNDDWQPLPSQPPRPFFEPRPGRTQKFPSLAEAPESGQRPLDLDYSPTDISQRTKVANGQPSGPYANSLATTPKYPRQFHPAKPIYQGPTDDGSGQKPQELDYSPKDDSSTSKRYPSGSPHVPANHRPIYDESNLYGGLLPPLPTPVPQQTTPSSTNVRTFPIYPPLANASASQQPHYPHYSPGYAAVAHSHNTSWQKAPNAVTNRFNPQIEKLDPQQPLDPFDTQQEETEPQYDYEEESQLNVVTSTTERRLLSPPPFNHHFYNPSKTAPIPTRPTDPISQLPISDALRLMLRPYLNHSGTIEDDVAQRAESQIMSVLNRPLKEETTTPMSILITTTTIQPDDDAELIVAGEQESLHNADDDSVNVADKGETARTEHTLHPNPTTYTSNDDVTNFHVGARGTRKVDTDRNNWQTHGHTRGFHLRHPNLPDPFDKPRKDDDQDKHHNRHLHPSHTHFHHQHSRAYHDKHPDMPNPFKHESHQHSEAFHRRRPDLPNPFAAHSEEKTEVSEVPKQVEESQTSDESEFLPHFNAEATTPKGVIEHDIIDFLSRGNFDANPTNARTPTPPCEFDCNNGRHCIKKAQVCDGVNNCGNRKDEQQCDHLGYEVRLTGGEKAHMGRIEVKVNGKWGYVCDDKFGLRDADVICHELGYKMGALEVRGSSFYPPIERNFNYAMDEVDCRGNETKLKDCDFKGWGVHNCGPDEVVGVVCKVPALKCPNNYWLCSTSKECIPPAFVCDHTADCADKSDESDVICKAPIQYRLEGGRSQNEGRLEVKYHGVWGSVCDDDFTLKSAQVACNSLGYYGPAQIEKNIFGPSNGPIWLDQVSCYGNESSIDKCNHWNWGEHNCNHTEDLGLLCKAGPPPRPRTRLQALSVNATKNAQNTANSLADIGLWERSSKALNTPRRCGIFKDDLEDEYAHPEQRVVQGAVARRGRHPWQATIRTRGRAGVSSHWCGAVLISKRHLLTAAHCVYGHPKGAYFVRLGDHYANIAESSEVDSFIERWYVHEKFRDQTHMNNDIAVVVLKSPVKFSDYIQPICLPDRGAYHQANRNCTISGWGSIKSGVSTPSHILRSAQLPILPDETCKQKHVYGDAMSDGMFCAGQMDESVDACEGDSGGPLVCSDEDGETLYGLISWGQHCGYANKPGVYVRVSHYIDWIYEKINLSLTRG
ncbi:uncharacterized protein LOC115628426 [Scaptodrosophila lebanonensis]|uniref:Uncharacterized protein LOC115628426 n=1 Tax=Drosophila lebanonensis TaxID=7225 RepID=A0A6J2TYY8_DROLE|nr:uncharacterized protein LOC115628426 [Scaptodrosophila lebanonensis]